MHLRRPYLIRVLAGAVFGLYMTHLLYFLNPQVDITPGRLVMVTLVYGIICGFLFGSILWVLRAARLRVSGGDAPDRDARGFGFIVLAAFVSAVVYWMHLTTLRQYLPIGAVRTLAIGTNLITVAAFALLVLWILERTADERRSRAIVAAGLLLIALSSLILNQRRHRYKPEKRTVVVANAGTVASQKPVIVVAIRNLPYDWIVTTIGEGGIPFFEMAARTGYFTRVEPFPTTSPKALWASLATGKLPYGHGVTGRFSYRIPLSGSDPAERFFLLPEGVGFRAWGLVPPVERISAQLPSGDALPLWTLFERMGMRAAVINWPASSSASASRVVADRTVRTGLRIHPDAARIAQRFNGTGDAQQRILYALSADATAVAALRAALAEDRFGINIAALEGFEEAQRAVHIFRNDVPPRSSLKGIAVRAYVQELDRLLATVASAFPQHLLVVVSPSAPVVPRPPTTLISMLQDAISTADRSAGDGFLLINGPGVAPSDKPPAAHVTDVVPTVLFAAGLPVARDMDGRVVSDAFNEQFLRTRPLSLIQTYEAQRIVVRRPGDA